MSRIRPEMLRATLLNALPSWDISLLLGVISGLALGQQSGVDCAGQVGPPLTDLLDLAVETDELGVAGGGELTAGGADLLLLGGEAVGFRLGGLLGLHGRDLGVLQDALASAELVDLALDGAEVAGGCGSRGEPHIPSIFLYSIEKI